MKYDLEERVEQFGENIISFAQTIRINDVSKPLIRQLIRSGTSIGANYLEANEASSKKDFKNKICISKKESNETKHWLRMIAKANLDTNDKCKELWQEAHELTLIFAKIFRTLET
jgi:four helix bundle protein